MEIMNKVNTNQRLISREKAIEITMNVNGVTRGMAERYTDSELREVLRLVRMKPAF